jgi:hypothetical protein
VGKLIKMTDTHNHRWKADRRFVKGFDYDNEKHANVPDDQKWMLPLFEAQKDPLVIAAHELVAAQACHAVCREHLRLVKSRDYDSLN